MNTSQPDPLVDDLLDDLVFQATMGFANYSAVALALAPLAV